MIQGDKTGLGGGRGPGCICMGIWERKKSKGLILQTLNWVNKRNLARGLHTGLKAYGMGPQCCCLDLQFLHCTIKFTFYLLISAVIFMLSTLNKVKKPWITELKFRETSSTLSSCATSTSVRDVPCTVGGLGLLLNSNKIKPFKSDWHKWYTQILHNIESVTLKEVFKFIFRWPKFYLNPCVYCILIIKKMKSGSLNCFSGSSRDMHKDFIVV